MMMPVMYQADPSVGSRRVSALVKDRDGEGEEMKPGPDVGFKRVDAVVVPENVDESSDFVRDHKCRC